MITEPYQRPKGKTNYITKQNKIQVLQLQTKQIL